MKQQKSFYLLTHDWHTCLLVSFFMSCALYAASGAGEKADPRRSARARLLAKLIPRSGETPREIQNPYWAKPAWRLWAEDPTPVTINKKHFKGTFSPPAPYKRKVPVFGAEPGSPVKLVPLRKRKGEASGFWDDCYMSLDNHHTRLRQLKGQFIDAGKMRHEGDPQTRLQLGVNFTSQSYADRGRAIVDDVINNLNTERFFFFANCIRATPAHISFKDKARDQVKDLYDGLHAHSYHSVGQSGSETHAIYKMMIAGASIRRPLKNLLKKHGAYAICLLTLFKAALPFADPEGRELPYEHELRHRPAYSSHGTPQHIHFCPANVHYHGYNDRLHLWTMARMAQDMTVAPPVTILKITGLKVRKGEETITGKAELTWHVKSICTTSVRIWGNPGETVTAAVDLTGSYDLQNQALHFTCKRLYPNQKNVQIEKKGLGKYKVTVSHDPELPKGRIPVICTARNEGQVPGNPAFVNFYWPGEKEMPNYMPRRGLSKTVRDKIKKLGLKRLPVTVNKRPRVEIGLLGDALVCSAGQTVSIPFKAVDPEGYPVKIFSRFGELGSFHEDRFVAEIPAASEPGVKRIHFIASDGTGGYTGRQLKLLVDKPKDKLPEGWGVTALGKVKSLGKVSSKGMSFTFSGGPAKEAGLRAKQLEGLFAFKALSGNVDIAARLEGSPERTQAGLLLTNTLDSFSRRAALGYLKGSAKAQLRPREKRWGGRQLAVGTALEGTARLFRIVAREGLTAVFASVKGKIWTQIAEEEIKWFETVYGGFIYGGSPAEVTWKWQSPPGTLPILKTGREKRTKAGAFFEPLKVAVKLPDNTVARYTVDGKPPTRKSPVVDKAITLSGAGRHSVCVTAFKGSAPSGTVKAVYELAASGKEEKNKEK